MEAKGTPAARCPLSCETTSLKNCCSPPAPQPPRPGLHPPCKAQHGRCQCSIVGINSGKLEWVDTISDQTHTEQRNTQPPVKLLLLAYWIPSNKHYKSSRISGPVTFLFRHDLCIPFSYTFSLTMNLIIRVPAELTCFLIAGCTSCGWAWWPAGWSTRDVQTSSTCSNTPHTPQPSAFVPEEEENDSFCF